MKKEKKTGGRSTSNDTDEQRGRIQRFFSYS